MVFVPIGKGIMREWRNLSGTAVFLAVLTTLAVLTGACASTGNVPRPFPSPAGSASAVPAPPRSSVVDTALAFRGVPYRNGGADPSGFDCSGFIQYVFAQHGIALPRAVEEQFDQGKKVKPRDLESGDLVFFKTVSRGPSHVGMIVGDDQFVHAPSSKGVVRVERLSAEYWSKRFIAARRVN
jgi:cell wall-associated NlpC family hydrolase